MATPIWTGGGADNLASTGLNWDTAVAPTTGDTATFDGAFPVTGSKNCTWDIADNLAGVTVTSGYSGTVTQTAKLKVASGGSALFTFDGGTWDSNGQLVQLGALGFDASGAGTKTLTMGASVWYCENGGGAWNFSGASMTTNYNTSTVLLDGTLTLTAPSVGLYNLEIDATNSGGTSITGSGTTVVNGYLDIAKALNNSSFNTGAISLKGDFKRSATNAGAHGSSVITFNGTGAQAWTDADSNNKDMRNPITVNKGGGTLTLSGTLKMGNGGPFTYTAGTVDPGTSTMMISQAMSINSGTMPWYNFTVYNSSAPTLTGNLNVTNNLTLTTALNGSSRTITIGGNFTVTVSFTASTSTVVFNGTNSTLSGGTTFNNLTINSGKTVHLTSTQTWVVSGLFTCVGATIDATTGASQALLEVDGTQSVSTTTATDIDSTGGNTVVNTGGTNSNTVNWTSPAAYIPRGLALLGVG